MLSEKVIDYLKSNNWWYDDPSQEYADALMDMNVPLESDFSKFYLHAEDSPNFSNGNLELYQVGWFILNSSYLDQTKNIQKSLDITENYIPLNSFEANKGYLYNKNDDSVIYIEAGQKLKNFQDGIIDTKWNSFNEFLEWYFGLN